MCRSRPFPSAKIVDLQSHPCLWVMDTPVPGPSRHNRASDRSRNIFETFQNDDSNMEDDFDIPHISDDSGSSSEDEEGPDLDLDLNWRIVKPQDEVARPQKTPC